MEIEQKKKLLTEFIRSGFSIFILGERGIGKSSLIEKLGEIPTKNKENYQKINCASLISDQLAQSELFGYEKGAFTGATAKREGLINKAQNGILFMDEIHHLSKDMQAKLMRAFQTDSENKLSIRPVGGEEIKVENVSLIFASNKSIPELQKLLLPDFYDRIVQHVMVLEPIGKRKKLTDHEQVKHKEEIKQHFQNVWDGLKFKNENEKENEETIPCPDDNQLLEWISTLPLYGNFRDLQKIAMYYNIYNKIKGIVQQSSPYDYAKEQFEKYSQQDSNTLENREISINLNITNTEKEIVKDAEIAFHQKLYQWAIEQYGDNKNAANKLGVEERTLYNWKNGITNKKTKNKKSNKQ